MHLFYDVVFICDIFFLYMHWARFPIVPFAYYDMLPWQRYAHSECSCYVDKVIIFFAKCVNNYVNVL